MSGKLGKGCNLTFFKLNFLKKNLDKFKINLAHEFKINLIKNKFRPNKLKQIRLKLINNIVIKRIRVFFL